MSAARKLRLAVVSPFLDNGYGTERIIIRWISALAGEFDTSIYSQRVQDMDLSKIAWRRIPTLPGPHLFNFIWWYFANQLWRAWDSRVRGLRPDVVFSPGINCPDADVISVHIVFAEFARRTGPELKFSRTPVNSWPRLLHRRLYYRLVIFLEGRAYRSKKNSLVLIAHKTAADLERFYSRKDRCLVLYLGLDHGIFNQPRRLAARENARKELGLAANAFVFLLVGNDLRKKGIRVLIESMQLLRDSEIVLLIATREDPAPFLPAIRAAQLESRIRFGPARSDVDFYYAAADAYVGPSLEDTFALPPVEAMACGLPAIVSRENGTCEIIEQEINGLILEDPKDAAALSQMMRRLATDKSFAAQIAERGAETASQFTWESNVQKLRAIFHEVAQAKNPAPGFTAQPAQSDSSQTHAANQPSNDFIE